MGEDGLLIDARWREPHVGPPMCLPSVGPHKRCTGRQWGLGVQRRPPRFRPSLSGPPIMCLKRALHGASLSFPASLACQHVTPPRGAPACTSGRPRNRRPDKRLEILSGGRIGIVHALSCWVPRQRRVVVRVRGPPRPGWDATPAAAGRTASPPAERQGTMAVASFQRRAGRKDGASRRPGAKGGLRWARTLSRSPTIARARATRSRSPTGP